MTDTATEAATPAPVPTQETKDEQEAKKGEELELPRDVFWRVVRYMFGVSCCPGFGACVADMSWGRDKKPEEMAPLPLDEPKEAAKLIAKRMQQVKASADPRPTCSRPVQMTMKGEMLKATPTKHPDVCCCTTTWPGRPFVMLIPFVIVGTAAYNKTTLGNYIVGLCLYAFMAAVCAKLCFCCGVCCGGRRAHTTGISSTIVYIINIKRLEKKSLQEAKKPCDKLRVIFDMAKRYLGSWCRSCCGCGCLRFDHCLMLAKVLFVMVLTEVLMPLSILFYVAARLAIGVVTWRACSAFGLVEEVAVFASIKGRLSTLMYPGLLEFKVGADEGELEMPDVEKPEMGCCGSCGCGSCGGCGACASCCDCASLCNFGCTMCSPACEIGCDTAFELGGDFVSMALVLFKATHYTIQIIERLEQRWEQEHGQEQPAQEPAAREQKAEV